MRGFEKEESLDTLPDKVVQKIIAVVELVETERIVPAKFFEKLTDTELYECRIRWESPEEAMSDLEKYMQPRARSLDLRITLRVLHSRRSKKSPVLSGKRST